MPENRSARVLLRMSSAISGERSCRACRYSFSKSARTFGNSSCGQPTNVLNAMRGDDVAGKSCSVDEKNLVTLTRQQHGGGRASTTGTDNDHIILRHCPFSGCLFESSIGSLPMYLIWFVG